MDKLIEWMEREVKDAEKKHEKLGHINELSNPALMGKLGALHKAITKAKELQAIEENEITGLKRQVDGMEKKYLDAQCEANLT
jgi:hypothetical protein